MDKFHTEIFTDAELLPVDWDRVASGNIFLSRAYLRVLQESAPANMTCYFIAISTQEELKGIAISQFIDLSRVKSFGERDNCLKKKVRTFAFRKLSSNVLVLGNNMLTGQNSCRFSEDMPENIAASSLETALHKIKVILKARGIPVHLTIFKDFGALESQKFVNLESNGYYKFSTQPNMVLNVRTNWKSAEDYFQDLIKKYRDQYKRARKKSENISKKKMSYDEIFAFNEQINALYHDVALKAPFNTFYLDPQHFLSLKKRLGDNFLFYGYFLDGELIGFNTLIKNGKDIDTYFLGYSETWQREKMLYLNMLYDMIGYTVNKKYKRIIFARTALEIKSSVGAKPVEMYGFVKHTNPLVNKYMPKLFHYFEPPADWTERHPFKPVEQLLSFAGE